VGLKIFLDDVRVPDPCWADCAEYTVVRTAAEFFSLLDSHGLADIEEITFDHDLGDYQPTGYDCIKRIEQMVSEDVTINAIPALYIHSQNPVGRKNIAACISSIHRIMQSRI
jgi:hypothetical protein